jgi:flagellar assembly protein FliH
MAATQKFLFDVSFDAPDLSAASSPALRKAPQEPTFTRAELEAARLKATAEGHAAGLAEANAAIEQRAAAALAALANGVAALTAARATLAAEMQARAAAVIRAIAQKVAPVLCRREPLAEIEALLRDCLGEQRDEPRIVLRVADALFEPMQRRLDDLAAAEGFAGKLVLLADPAMGPGDCRVEWADGGAERNIRRLLTDIDAALARFAAPTRSEENSP